MYSCAYSEETTMTDKMDDKTSPMEPIIEKAEIQPSSAYTVIHHDGGGSRMGKNHEIQHDGGGTLDSETDR
jgi:hypothetical protein